MQMQQKSVIDSLSFRLNDLIAFAKEVYEENHILVEHAKETKDIILSKEQEIEAVVSDNKKLSQQIHDIVSKKTLTRTVQTEVENEDMEIFDEIKEKCAELEDQVDTMQSKLREKDKRIGSLQRELDLKNQELLKSS